MKKTNWKSHKLMQM
jgi:hypothetical protein